MNFRMVVISLIGPIAFLILNIANSIQINSFEVFFMAFLLYATVNMLFVLEITFLYDILNSVKKE